MIDIYQDKEEYASYFDSYEAAKRYYEGIFHFIGDRADRPTLIVEGTTDDDILSNVFACRIIPLPNPEEHGATKPYSKGILEEFLKWLKNKLNYKHFIGIVDADAERIECLLGDSTIHKKNMKIETNREGFHVFTTDWHDLDVHAFWASADFVINRLFDSNEIDFILKNQDITISRDIKGLLNAIHIPAIGIGILRYVLNEKKIPQKYLGKDLYDNKYLTPNLEFHLIKAIVDSDTTKKEKIEMKDSYLALRKKLSQKKSKDNWRVHIVNGHDLIRLLGLCYIAAYGQHLRMQANDTIPKLVRKRYRIDDFKKTNLYQKIINTVDSKAAYFGDG